MAQLSKILKLLLHENEVNRGLAFQLVKGQQEILFDDVLRRLVTVVCDRLSKIV